VHAVLARAPFDATRDVLENIAAAETRLLAMDGADAAAAAAVVERVLSHDLLKRAGRAAGRGACRRETPITFTLDDGTLVEGVVDLAFEEDGAWTVVDYKTDREIADRGEEQYRRQVALYASAIARATGASTSGVLLRL
jgi:ATP-dependent helicase/nuclease subunit A